VYISDVEAVFCNPLSKKIKMQDLKVLLVDMWKRATATSPSHPSLHLCLLAYNLFFSLLISLVQIHPILSYGLGGLFCTSFSFSATK
jgi:acyl-CoA thioesterase